MGASMIAVLAAAALQAPATAAPRRTDHIRVRPVEGPGGTQVRVRGYVAGNIQCGTGFKFIDSTGFLWPPLYALLKRVRAGRIDTIIHVPTSAALGLGRVRAYPLSLYQGRQCVPFGNGINAKFSVTDGPGIFGFKLKSGPIGTLVTIKGIRFTGATKVMFHGTASVFSVDSDSKITATVPAGAITGPIKIVTPIGTAISGANFRVT